MSESVPTPPTDTKHMPKPAPPLVIIEHAWQRKDAVMPPPRPTKAGPVSLPEAKDC
jgi:hypothetical protein